MGSEVAQTHSYQMLGHVQWLLSAPQHYTHRVCKQLCCAVPLSLCCADAVLDACLAQDPNSKVACETAVKDNFMLVRGCQALGWGFRSIWSGVSGFGSWKSDLVP